MSEKQAYDCAPVLLIGFNRPDFMAVQIAAVRAARPTRLYIAVDGAREGWPDEAEKCRAVRECAKLVDWTCEVKTLFREKNHGCKMGVSGAITWFFENEEEGIVLEDDCRPSPDFFRFVTEMLARYRDDERIGIVTGFNHFNLQSDKTASYHFSSHLDIWGWASWRRVWAKYDVTMEPYIGHADEVIGASAMTPYFKMFMRKGIQEVQAGQCNTWDFQFALAALSMKWLCVVPRRRLIANVGLTDGGATHTNGYNYYAESFARVGKIDFPLAHPAAVVCDERADLIRERMEGAVFPRGLTWLGSKMPLLCPLLSVTGKIVERIAPVLFRL